MAATYEKVFNIFVDEISRTCANELDDIIEELAILLSTGLPNK